RFANDEAPRARHPTHARLVRERVEKARREDLSECRQFLAGGLWSQRPRDVPASRGKRNFAARTLQRDRPGFRACHHRNQNRNGALGALYQAPKVFWKSGSVLPLLRLEKMPRTATIH